MAARRVMVVDDAALMRRVVAEVFASEPGWDIVASCGDGRAALSRLREARPDVIVLDLEMPVMDGLTFLRHARTLTAASIVVLSSKADLGTPAARTARRLGADAVIHKSAGAVSVDLRATTGARILATVRRLAA